MTIFFLLDRIPVVFEGDLAHIAASHLKEKDHICVEGQLCPGSPAFHDTPGQTNIQVVTNVYIEVFLLLTCCLSFAFLLLF